MTPSDPDAQPGAQAPGAPFTYQGVEFKGECVPAARAYYLAKHTIPLPFLPAAGIASELWNSIPTPLMSRHPNDGASLPLPDDLLIWAPWGGGVCNLAGSNPYGHVAIVVAVRAANEIIVVDSNFTAPLAGGQHTVALDSCVLGWLRPNLSGAEFPSLLPVERHAGGEETGTALVQPQGVVSVGSGIGGALSRDGRFLAYVQHSAGIAQAWVLDRVTGEKRRVSMTPTGGSSNLGCDRVAITADGSRVAFQTVASNIAISDGNGFSDLFYRDPANAYNPPVVISGTAATSTGNMAALYPGFSPEGGWAVFSATSTNIAPSGDPSVQQDVFFRQLPNGPTSRVRNIPASIGSGFIRAYPSASGNAAEIVFIQDNHVWLYKRATATAERVSVTPTGVPSEYAWWFAQITPSGKHIAFSGHGAVADKTSTTYADVFVQNRQGVPFTTRASKLPGQPEPNGQSGEFGGIAISDDGRFPVFATRATNTSPGWSDTNGRIDVVVRDMVTNRMAYVSKSFSGGEANGDSYWPSISGDGAFISLVSRANNLIANDPDQMDHPDLFVFPNPLFQPDLVILSFSGHSFSGGPPFAYLQDSGDAVEAIASAYRADYPGRRVFSLGFVDSLDDVNGQLGFRSAVRWMRMIRDAWVVGQPSQPMIILVGHSHGGTWAHAACTAVSDLTIHALVDLDTYCDLSETPEPPTFHVVSFETEHGAAISAFLASAPQPDFLYLANPCDGIVVQGALEDLDDFVPDNVVSNVEVYPFAVGLDLRANRRRSGSTTGCVRSSPIGLHWTVHRGDSASMQWVLAQLRGLPW